MTIAMTMVVLMTCLGTGETGQQPESPTRLGEAEAEDPAAHDQAQTHRLCWVQQAAISGWQTNKEVRIAPSLNLVAGLQTSSETGFLLQPDVGRGVRAGQGLPHQLHVPRGCLSEKGVIHLFPMSESDIEHN